MRTRVWALAMAAALTAGCGVTSGKASTVSAEQSPAARSKVGKAFGTFDNTVYKNVNLEAFGFTKSNVIYPPSWIDQAAQQGKLPDENLYKQYVKARVKNPGPVVLDFEGLYLYGRKDVVEKRFNVLYATAKWTHEVAPHHVVGFYGLDGHTDVQNYMPLAKQLATREDAFFPTLYTTRGTDTKAWTNLLKADVAQARKVDPRKPVFLYMWPQYHDGTPMALQFIPAWQWTYELNTAYKFADGFVFWSGSGTPQVPAADRGWVTATQQFMKTHHR